MILYQKDYLTTGKTNKQTKKLTNKKTKALMHVKKI